MSKGIQFKNKGGEKVYPCPFYPVGSVYISFSSTNPSTFFGGSWERIKGKFLLSADDSTYKINQTGGEASHKLTINEMPSNNHGFQTGRWFWAETAGGGEIINSQSETSYAFKRGTDNTGGSQAHNNMPPYIAVYMWRRTA